MEPVSLVDELGHSVSGCVCERCGDEDPDGCPCFSEMEELDMANECGPSCGCGLECENRLTQRGVSMRLKIVRDRRKGWALYADQFIEKAQFVCEYAGTFFFPSTMKLKMEQSKNQFQEFAPTHYRSCD